MPCAMIRQSASVFAIKTTGRGLVAILFQVLALFVRHTSASPLVQENADREVRADLGLGNRARGLASTPPVESL